MPDSDAAPTPSVETPAPSTDGAAAPTPSAESGEPGGSGLFDRLFRREKTAQAEPKVSDGTTSEGKDQSQPSAAKREYSDDEFARAVQAETDRRESKRAAEQRLAEKNQLREEDPYAYVDQEKAEEARREAEQQFTSLLGTVAQQFDAVLLDPLMERLPEGERSKLIGDDKLNAGTLESRKALQTAALEVLVKQAKAEGKAEAEAALRKNPAFRKQILTELRRSDDLVEPELVPASAAAPNGTGMNDWMRSRLGRYRPRE